LTAFDLVDPDRKPFSNLTRNDFASHAENQDISQQIAMLRHLGNLGKQPNREKDDVSRGRHLYWREEQGQRNDRGVINNGRIKEESS
jgi:hypothetical protein